MKRVSVIVCFLLMCIVSVSVAQTQNWAVGVEVGEPTAISVRKYGNRNALDVSLGTYTGLLKGKKSYRKGQYASIGMMFNATYLWYAPLMNERISAYGGVGAQINSRRYYPDKNVKSVHDRAISTGPSITLGLEFFSQNTPNSFFVEAGGYLEMMPKLFYFNPNLSIGIRRNF